MGNRLIIVAALSALLAAFISLPKDENGIVASAQALHASALQPDLSPDIVAARPIPNEDILNCVAKRDSWQSNYSLSPSGSALVYYHQSKQEPTPYARYGKQGGRAYKIYSSRIKFRRHSSLIKTPYILDKKTG